MKANYYCVKIRLRMRIQPFKFDKWQNATKIL